MSPAFLDHCLAGGKIATDVQVTAVLTQNCANNRKAQSTAGYAGRRGAIKTLREQRQMFGWNAGAIVLHRALDATHNRRQRHHDCLVVDGFFADAIFDGVVQQIQENLFQPVWLPKHDEMGRLHRSDDRRANLLRAGRHLRHRSVHDFKQIHRLDILLDPVFQPAKLHCVRHQTHQTLRFVAHELQRLRLHFGGQRGDAQNLNVRRDRSQRRA